VWRGGTTRDKNDVVWQSAHLLEIQHVTLTDPSWTDNLADGTSPIHWGLVICGERLHS